MATMNYKCPNCGGPLQFNPDKQMFSCEYCASDFDVEKIQQLFAESEKAETADESEVEHSQAEQAQAQAKGEDFDEENLVSYSCPSCGAEVITAESTAATTCYYCQNPVVLGSRLSGEFKPDSVIPFALTREKAQEAFLKMCGRRMFLPRGFASKTQFDNLHGVYFPYWYVDERMESSVVATGKKVRHWTSGDRNYTETSTYRIFRTGDLNIKNVFEEALRGKDSQKGSEGENSKEAMKYLSGFQAEKRHDMLQCVHPFDVSKAKPFSMSYLSGFQAEKRELDKEDVSAEIARRMDNYAQSLLKDTMVGYDGISVESYNDETLDQKWRYTLLPVWIVTYKYKGKILPFAINGQTGKTYGKLPIAAGKLIGWGGIVAAIVFVIAMLGGLFFA